MHDFPIKIGLNVDKHASLSQLVFHRGDFYVQSVIGQSVLIMSGQGLPSFFYFPSVMGRQQDFLSIYAMSVRP